MRPRAESSWENQVKGGVESYKTVVKTFFYKHFLVVIIEVARESLSLSLYIYCCIYLYLCILRISFDLTLTADS